MSTQRPAISYTRFSDPKQALGDSENRQAQRFADFCQRHRLTPAKEAYADRGLSGFRGAHRSKGDMGRLEKLAESGAIEPGTVIVIEAWDRLGRQRPDRAIEHLSKLLRAGLAVGVCRLDDIFTEEDFGTHKFTTLAVFVQLAHQESKQKSERVADSWQRRRLRARADKKLMTTRLPGWLERKGGAVRVVPSRAKTVRRIFELAAAGYGVTRIVQTLTEEGIPAFGEQRVRAGRKRSQFSGHWTRPYVRLILNDRRALGEMQPCRLVEKGGKWASEPDGPAVAGYFPAVVTKQEFLLARLGAESRRNKDLGRETRQAKYVNVFAGLLRNAEDGEGFVLHNKGTAARPGLILVNARGNEGRGRCVTFPYPIFEEAILSRLEEIDPRDLLPTARPQQVTILQARLKELAKQVEQITADLREGYSKALTALLREKEAEHAGVKEQLEAEQARAVRPLRQDWKDFQDLARVLAGAADPDDARLRLRALLRRTIDTVWLRILKRGATQLLVAQVWFAEAGLHRDYLIVRQSAANRRPGGWRVKDFSDIAPTRQDLRDPARAAALERALLALDVEQLWEKMARVE
jgi:DNA invertase Pin-like site-specific DNA recombinase